MDIEEMYMTLYGASQTTQQLYAKESPTEGAKYDIVEKWFKECGIIDDQVITSHFFETSYARVKENKYDLSLSQFAQLLGILSRDTNQELEDFGRRFKCVNQRIIEEIQATYND